MGDKTKQNKVQTIHTAESSLSNSSGGALLGLWKSFSAFVRKDFHLLSYIYTFVFIVIFIFLNYHFKLYNTYIRPSFFDGNSGWIMPLFYAFFYFGTAIPIFFFQKRYDLLKNKKFYIKSIIIIAAYGFAIGYYSYRQWEFPDLFRIDKLYLFRVLSQLKAFCFLFLPFLLMKIYIDKDVKGLYGLSRNSKHIRGYLMLFLMLLPFLIATSFTPDFLKAYPQFQPWLYEGAFNMPTWLYTTIFESVYALDFVMVELVFRGVLVIGMISLLGPKAVLPMVAMYAAIHFGKPMGETISSIFGGYILGAFAYETRHIWGGVIVHILIALTMEIMGFFHYYN